MAFTRFSDPTNNISNLANQPVEPPATLKQKFDQVGEDLKDWANNTFLPELEAITNGDSGADNIGATPVGAGVSATVQGIMEELDAKIDTQLPTPDGSITDAKLSNSQTDLKQRFANLNIVNVKDYGAVGDGVTDDTDSIISAISASKIGGVVYFPATNASYYVSNSALPYLFLIDKPLNIIGDGIKSTIKLATSIPNTTDVFLISPDPAKGTEGFVIKGIHIAPQSGRPARHAIHLDITNVGQQIRRLLICNNFIRETGGHSIYLTNPVNTDGFYTSWIQQNTIWAGINLQRAGDSIIIKENIIPGYNSVDISLLSGANSLVYEKNNQTCRGGFILRSGINCKIIKNNFEIAYADTVTTNSAYVDIDGSNEITAYGMLAVDVSGNNITYQAATAPNGIDAIRVNLSRGTVIERNHISQKTSNLINITSIAQNTIIGYNIYSYSDPSGGVLIVDNGLGTVRLLEQEDVAALAENEIWMANSATVRNKGTRSLDKFSTFDDEGASSSLSAVHRYIWPESVVTGLKHVFSVVKRFTATGNLDTPVDVMYIDSEKVVFPVAGYALQGVDGFRRRFQAKASAPASGAYIVGDIVWNTSPTPGGYVGFVCTTAGSPGTWKGFGLIQA